MIEAVSSLVRVLSKQPSKHVVGPDQVHRVQVALAQLIISIAVRRCQEKHPAWVPVTGRIIEQRLRLTHVLDYLRGDHNVELPTRIVTPGMAHAHINPTRTGNLGLAFIDLDANDVAIAQILQDQPMPAAKLKDAAWPTGSEMAINKGHLLVIDGPRVFTFEALDELAHGSVAPIAYKG